MDIAKALGSSGGTSVQCLTIYVPNKTRHGNEIGDQRRWVLAGAQLLAEIGGGVTIMPPVEGGWMDESGAVVWESPILIYTFVRPNQLRQLLPRLRDFLHQMGRETDQGEVALEFDGRFYRITKFDVPPKRAK